MGDFGSSEVLLRLEGVERRLGGRLVVRGIDLVVRAGEVVGLLGPNGAGKTTTFRMVAGLDDPDGGRVWFGGKDVRGVGLDERARRGLAYLPQEPSIFRGLTVLENLLLVSEVSGRGVSRVEAMERLRAFGLEALASRRAVTLSGGERRRLELARAMVLEPSLLVYDEPLTGIDPRAASEVRSLLRGLAEQGVGVLLTDHNVAEALPACDRAALMVDGVIVEEGTARDLLRSESARRAYFGDLWREGEALAGSDGRAG